MDYQALLLTELKKRINPEISRTFRPVIWEKSLGRLMEFSLRPEFEPQGLRISVVGSNGKGSTAFYLDALAGGALERGLFISPHLLHVNERIRLNGRPVEARELWEAFEELREIDEDLYDKISYFELLTISSLYIFRKKNVQFQVFEAGLGGRLDATGMARSQVVILTGIEIEHAEVLGDTPEKILAEKLGMIGEQTRLLLTPPRPGPSIGPELISRIALSLKPDLEIVFYETSAERRRSSYLEYNFGFAQFIHRTMARHFRNESFAAALPASPPSGEARRPPALPGRMETLEFARQDGRRVRVIFDTAHNLAAIELSLQNLTERPEFPGASHTAILLGLLPDRDLKGALGLAENSGFRWIYNLKADFLAQGPADLEARRSSDRLFRGSLEIGRIRDFLESETEDLKLVFIAGSHRNYYYFNELRGNQ